MKVCDIVQFYSPLSGGVKRYVHDKMHTFADHDAIRHVLVIPSYRDVVHMQDHTKVYEVKSLPLIGSRSYRMLLSRKRLSRIIERERPDVIEVGDPYRSAWIAAELGRRLHIPVVAYYHSDYPRALGRTLKRFVGAPGEHLLNRCTGPYLNRLYNRMERTMVATQRLLHELEQLGIQRLEHMPLGVDVSIFRPRASRARLLAELGLPDSTILLMYAGRLAREKNINRLMSMMEHEPAAGAGHLILVGDGEQRAYVEKEAGRRSRVNWLPYCESADLLAEWYSAADLFIHAGTCETFGLSALEALACGTPVLAVRGGGVDTILEDPSFSVLAESADPRDLAMAARSFARHPSREEREARHEYVQAHYSSEAMCSRLLKVYEEVIVRRGRALSDADKPNTMA